MKKTLISFLTLLTIIFTAPFAFAQNNPKFINIGARQGAIPGVPANTSVGNLTANALQIVYIFAGLAVLFFFIWGAFDWITAGGDKEKIAGARRKIVNSLIGLALLALSLFIISLFGQIVGINPLKMGIIPTLGQQAIPIRTTP